VLHLVRFVVRPFIGLARISEESVSDMLKSRFRTARLVSRSAGSGLLWRQATGIPIDGERPGSAVERAGANVGNYATVDQPKADIEAMGSIANSPLQRSSFNRNGMGNRKRSIGR
jgi:hypothetical protein